MLSKGAAELLPRGDVEGTERHTVVRRIEGDDPRATGRQEGRFDCDLYGVGPGDRKVDLGVVHGRPAAKAIGQTYPQGMCLDVAQTVEQPTRLTTDGSDNPRVAVPHGRDTKARRQIEESIAVDIENVGTLGLLPEDVGCAGEQSVDTGSLRACQGSRELPGARPGRGRENLGEQVPPGEACHLGSMGARRQTSCLPVSERARVTSSVYSMSPPTGMPNARRVTLTCLGLSRRAR